MSKPRSVAPANWLTFGPFLLDPQRRLLFRGAESIQLRKKTMSVLCHLAQRSGMVVSREELIDAVWPNVTVRRETVANSIAELRRLFGDSRTQPKYIETRHGEGFRFVPSVRLVRTNPPELAGAAPALEPAQFLGREAELQILRMGMARAWQARAAAVVLWGPAGIGKTRLLEQFTGEATRGGARVLWSRASHTSEDSAFWLWTQIIRAFAESSSPVELRDALAGAAADILLIAPSLQENLPALKSPGTLDPQIAYTRLFDGVIGFLGRVAAERPLVLMLDDLHMASSNSLGLLQIVISEIRNGRLLVVGTYRATSEPTHGALPRVLQTVRSVGGEVAQIGDLAEAEMRSLVAEQGVAEIDPALIDKILHDAAGNPWFASEILRSLREVPAAARNHYRVPESIHRVLEERLQTLSAEARRFLPVAAGAGSTFDPLLAITAAGLGQSSASRIIPELTAAGYIAETEASDLHLRFTQELLRAQLLQSLPRLARADLHECIGEALETAPRHDDSVYALAHHFSQAPSIAGQQKGIRYCLLAGQQALARHAYDEACQLFERARELVGRTGPRMDDALGEILAGLVEAHRGLGHREEAAAIATQLHNLIGAVQTATAAPLPNGAQYSGGRRT